MAWVRRRAAVKGQLPRSHLQADFDIVGPAGQALPDLLLAEAECIRAALEALALVKEERVGLLSDFSVGSEVVGSQSVRPHKCLAWKQCTPPLPAAGLCLSHTLHHFQARHS